MANFVYVDNSNVWIEGMHLAAVRTGIAPNIWIAQNERITAAFRIDFGKLYEFAGGRHGEVGRAVLYGSRPPANDSLWATARDRGFEPVVFDRSVSNREKKIDTQITADITEDLFTKMGRHDEVTLVAGDRDFVPVAEKVRHRDIPFHVVFWSHAARELRDIASTFVDLDLYFDHLRL